METPGRSALLWEMASASEVLGALELKAIRARLEGQGGILRLGGKGGLKEH